MIRCLVLIWGGLTGSVHKEEAEEDNESHGKEDEAIEDILFQAELSN